MKTILACRKTKYIFFALFLPVSLIIGAGEGWGSFMPLLIQKYGYTSLQLQTLFGSIILAFSLGVFVLGRLINRTGELPLLFGGSILYGFSFFVSGSYAGNIFMLDISLIMQGLGMSAVYIAMIQLCARIFQQRQGVVTGFLLSAYAMGVYLSAKIVNIGGISETSVSHIISNLSLLYGLPIVILSGLICIILKKHKFTPVNQADSIIYLGDRYTIVLAIATMVTGLSGYLILSNMALLAKSFGYGTEIVPIGFAIFAIGNATGRLIWGLVSDMIGAHRTVKLSFLIQLIILPFLVSIHKDYLILQAVLMFVGGICFGAFVVVFAVRTKQYYGTDRFGSVYSVVALAFGVAGFLGPAIGGWSYDHYSSYKPAIIIIECLLVLGFFIYAWFSSSKRIHRYAAAESLIQSNQAEVEVNETLEIPQKAHR